MAPSVAIVGAGPAGLTLARILQVESIDIKVTVFEKDASPTARASQGGTLDLHADTGLAALKRAGLFDEFLKYARYEGEELVIADKNASELVHMRGGSAPSDDPEARPEIDREKLKDMLLESVDPAIIQWGKHLKSIDVADGTLHFADGSTEGSFDLVVGCDGAWSRVRQVLTDVRPHYSGICGFNAQILNPATEHPRLSKMVGRGSYFAYSDFKSMTAQRMANDSLKLGVWLMRGEDYAAKLLEKHGRDEAKLKEEIVAAYSDWVPELQEWVRASTNFTPWPLYELPVGHTWPHKKGYTLISDAASLMTPFAGEGVNKGMRDAFELSDAISNCVKEGGDLDEAVAKFETGMFPRAKKVQLETMTNKTHMFRADAPIGFLVKMMDVLAERQGQDPTKGIMRIMLPPGRLIAFCYFWTLTSLGSLRRRLRGTFARLPQK